MITPKLPDQGTYTVICTINGGPCHHALVAGTNTEFFASLKTQIIIHNMGEADLESKKKQVPGTISRNKDGVYFKPSKEAKIQDFICAAVISRIHDQIGGKFEGSSFTFQSNDLNFNAKWAYGAGKFVY